LYYSNSKGGTEVNNISIFSKAGAFILFLSIFLIVSCQSGEEGAEGAEEAQEVTMVTIPEGTTVEVSLQDTIGTQENSSGDMFTTETTEPIMVDGNVIVPAGSTIRGTLTEVVEPEKETEDATMTLTFNTVVMPDGEEYSFDTHSVTLKTESDTRGDVEKVAAGTLAGAVIGAIAKGEDGAKFGAIVGAATGGAIVLATQENRIKLEPGQKFLIQTKAAVEVPEPQTTTEY
jgi:hypothetical protein